MISVVKYLVRVLPKKTAVILGGNKLGSVGHGESWEIAGEDDKVDRCNESLNCHELKPYIKMCVKGVLGYYGGQNVGLFGGGAT